MRNKLHIGIVGMGNRGRGLMENCILKMPDIEVAAICDSHGESLNAGAAILEKTGGKKPHILQDYYRLIALLEVEVVLALGAWHTHGPVALGAMRADKPVATEVSCRDTVEQCWELVRTHEETGVPYMMLEDCCYARNEMLLHNMERQGVFGEIVHVAGGYMHDCRPYMLEGGSLANYRLRNYLNRSGDSYPTHALGPLSQLLRLGRGNRMLTLSSFASKSAGVRDLVDRTRPADDPLRRAQIKQGDIITTVITCANGETMVLTLDTTLPRPYSRGYTVRGTRGMYLEDNNMVFLENEHHHRDKMPDLHNNLSNYYEKYEHPMWREYLAKNPDGHGGDFMVLRRFFDAVKAGEQTPIDAYDSALWGSILPLTEMSIARGGAPVDVPDFTNGKWMWREYVSF